jgi:L1 cell adhesion molecule like protein
MSVMIERNTTIPVTYTLTLTTSSDNQAAVSIKVFEGEKTMAKYNNLVAKFNLVGIPPALANVPLVNVIFDIDVNGMLNVTAVVQTAGKRKKLAVYIDKGQ